MFGITFLKGPDNLNFISFVHKQKENVEEIKSQDLNTCSPLRNTDSINSSDKKMLKKNK